MFTYQLMAKISLFWCFLFLPLILNFSEANDEKVGDIYELKKGDFSVKLTNYGATVLSVLLPDKNGLSFISYIYIYDFKFSIVLSSLYN